MKNKKYIIAGISLALLLVAGIATGAFFLLKPKEDEEGCWFRGRIYQSEEEFETTTDGMTCVCSNGEVICDSIDGGDDAPNSENIGANKNDEEVVKKINPSDSSNNNNSEKKSVNTSEGVEYAWYEDEYIKFKYPKNWSAEVKSGKFTDEDSDFDGVREITLSSDNDEIALSISGLFGLGLGGGGFHYEIDEPKKIYFDHPGDSTLYVLSEDVYRKESDKVDDLVVSYFSYYWVDERYAYDFDEDKYVLQEEDAMAVGVEGSWGLGKYSEENGKKIFYENFLWAQTDLAEENFITGTGKIYGSTSKDTLQNTELLLFSELSVEDEAEFQKYVEIFGEFFNSIERN